MVENTTIQHILSPCSCARKCMQEIWVVLSYLLLLLSQKDNNRQG